MYKENLPPRLEEFHQNFQRDHSLIKTTGKWALSSVQLTVGSTVGATERNKPFPRKVCITACCAIFRTKHCVNRNGGMHSCAARQEGNYTLTQSSDSHSWSSAHKKHTGTVLSWTQAVCPTQNTILFERVLIALTLRMELHTDTVKSKSTTSIFVNHQYFAVLKKPSV